MKILIFLALLTSLTIVSLFAQKSTAQEPSLPPLLTAKQPQMHPAPPETTPLEQPPSTVKAHPPTPPLRPGAPLLTPSSIKELLKNVNTAVATAEKVKNHLKPGKVWIRKGPAGETEIKAGVLYQGSVAAVLNFSPVDGSVLPLGFHVRIAENNIKLEQIQNNLANLLNRLQLLPAAEFREPEASWIFPLCLDHSIVAHLKIYFDGVYVVPDYPANQEMIYYGK